MTFDEFVDDRLAPLLGFARVLCGERATAEDLVHDVLLRAQSRWSRIASTERPEAYVRRMLINEFLSWRRRASRLVSVAEVPDRSADGPDAAAVLADRDELVRELAKLPRRQRTVVVLRYYAGLDIGEIAAELGCGESTVRSHLARGLQTLRVEMAANLAEGRP